MGGESGALMQSQTRNEDSLEFVNNKERVQLAELHKTMMYHQREHKQENEQRKLGHHHSVHHTHLTKHRDASTGVSQGTGGHMESMKKTAREMEHEYRTILETMVQQPRLGNEYQPPSDMISTAEGIFDTIESELDTEKDTSQQEINDANSKIKECNDDKKDGYTRPNGINDRKATSDSNRQAHKTCREEENRLICKTKVECDAFNAKQQKSCEHEQNWYVAKVDSTVKNTAAPSLGQLITQAESCRTNLAAEHSHAAECDGKQSVFEISFCQYADRLQKVSDAYEQCYDQQEEFRNRVVANVEILERDGKLIWKMVKKIRCYIESLKDVEYTNKLPLQSDIDRCTSLDPDTTPLDIAYTAPEPRESCDLSTIQSWPGKADKQFYEEEYNTAMFQTDCKMSGVPEWQAALHPAKLTNVEVCTLMNAWHAGQGGAGLVQVGSSSV